MSKNKFTLLAVVLFWITGCSDYRAYHQFYSIPEGKWSKTDSLIYEIPNLPQTATLQLELRFTSEYPYKDIYVGVRENLSDSTSFRVDTLRIPLTHIDGRSKGSSLGKLYQTATAYKTIKHPQKSKSNQVYIYPLMNDSVLEGIEDVGLRISHANDVHVQRLDEGTQTAE